MNTASVKTIREELRHLSPGQLQEIVLRLSRFKKENKELLTYLLFLSSDENRYIEEVKEEMDQEFENINKTSYYFIKKSIRKILRMAKKNIRYSGKKETEVELLLYFLKRMNQFQPSIHKDRALHNLYSRQLRLVTKSCSRLHEDLQFDWREELVQLKAAL